MASAPAVELEVDYLVYKDNSGAEVVKAVSKLGVPVGGICSFAMPKPPDGWLVCDGSNNLLISDFPELHEAISLDVNCSVANGSGLITIQDPSFDTGMIPVGSLISGPNIPAGSTVTSLDTPTTFVITNAATGTNTANLRINIWGVGSSALHFKIPDLRGEFLRGWDSSRGVDSNRKFADYQPYALKQHGHTASIYAGNGGTAGMNNNYRYHQQSNVHFNLHNTGVSAGFSVTSDNIADEVRPRNISVQYCIKF